MTDVVHILALDKPFLRLSEACELACISETQFRRVADGLGIHSFPWAGVRVYRRADILAAMEDAAWQHFADEGVVPASAGTSTGTSQAPAPGDSVADRLDTLERSRKRKHRSRSRPNRSSSAKVARLGARRR